MRHAFLIAAFASMVQARSPVIWTETAMERVGLTDAARENKTAELFAARGEYEPFQVVVQAAEGGLHNVTFRIGDLKGLAGHFISRANLTVYGFTGLLYWAVDHWTQKPWEDVETYTQPKENAHYPGEGMLVYPGDAAGVPGTVPSIRLKWIREGVEDYEYVEMLKHQGRGDWALSLVRQIATDFENWSDDPAALERTRRIMGEALSRQIAAPR